MRPPGKNPLLDESPATGNPRQDQSKDQNRFSFTRDSRGNGIDKDGAQRELGSESGFTGKEIPGSPKEGTKACPARSTAEVPHQARLPLEETGENGLQPGAIGEKSQAATRLVPAARKEFCTKNRIE